jgi:phage terminase large subunit-like protein
VTPLDIEPFQERALKALNSSATHILLYGGARSGKTHLIVLWLVLRALAKPLATHAILRHHFAHLKASIIYDTLPDVCARNFPDQKVYTLNKSDWYAEFSGGGRIWFGGLDDKERTEKILGQGHSTIYLNEASTISYASRLKAITRLSQQRGLRLKEVCDENPPIAGHWTQRLWLNGIDPSTGQPVPNPRQYAVQRMNPANNPHIPEATKNILRSLPPRERSRFWDGEFGQGTESALWTYESIEAARVERIPEGVSLTQCVVAIDPSGCHGPEDKRSDEVGIVAGGLGSDGIVYVLEDASGRYGPGGKDGWGARGATCYHRWGADRVVGEINFGGAMVGAVMQTADSDVPFREVTASRGKSQRAEPVSNLTDQGKVKFVGHFPELEQQLLGFSTAGYMGERSPDRADAFVWMAYALGVVRMPGQGALDWMREQATNLLSAASVGDVEAATDLVTMQAPSHISGTYYSRNGARFAVEDGRVRCGAEDVADLESAGFRRIS